MRARCWIAMAYVVAVGVPVQLGCARGGEPAGEMPVWEMPVPDGARVVRHEPVPLEDRTETVRLAEDLVFGQGRGDPIYAFYRVTGVAVAASGDVFVLDAGARQVTVFSAAGDHLMTLGGTGEGPGEMSRPGAISVAGDRVVVQDNGRQSFLVWSVDGRHLGDFGVLGRRAYRPLVALLDGRMLGQRRLTVAEAAPDYSTDREQIVIEVDVETGEERRLVEFPAIAMPTIRRTFVGGSGGMRVGVPVPEPRMVAAPDGRFFVTASGEYQVFAHDVSGAMLWALWVPLPREPITDDEVDGAMQRVRQGGPVAAFADADASEVEIPSHKPALSDLLVDGKGNLYVVPYLSSPEADRFPVDVYTPEGERLFSGWMPRRRWLAAVDDTVYALRSDEEDNVELVRYRLALPF